MYHCADVYTRETVRQHHTSARRPCNSYLRSETACLCTNFDCSNTSTARNTFRSMQHQAQSVNTKFAWLTPLHDSKKSHGPWILSDNETQTYSALPIDARSKISVDGLLTLLSSILDTSPLPTELESSRTITSACGLYGITSYKQGSDSSRLFVQRKEDFYTRIELYIEGKLIVSFQEPIWPFLQDQVAPYGNRLEIPNDCLNWLEKTANEACSPLHQANQNSTAMEHQAA